MLFNREALQSIKECVSLVDVNRVNMNSIKNEMNIAKLQWQIDVNHAVICKCQDLHYRLFDNYATNFYRRKIYMYIAADKLAFSNYFSHNFFISQRNRMA